MLAWLFERLIGFVAGVADDFERGFYDD